MFKSRFFAAVVLTTIGLTTLGPVAANATDTWRAASEISLADIPGATSGSIDALHCADEFDCVAAGTTGDGKLFVATEVDSIWGPATPLAGDPIGSTSMTGTIAAVDCVSVGNCLVVGRASQANYNRFAFSVALVDGVWGTPQDLPGVDELATDGSSEVSNLVCFSSGDCALFGLYNSSGSYVYTMTWKNGTWSAVTTIPNVSTLSSNPWPSVISVSCQSATTCTIAGQYSDDADVPQIFVDSETNGTWATPVVPPDYLSLNLGVFGGYVSGLSCSAVGECVLAGSYDDVDDNSVAYLATETGGVWSHQTVTGLSALDLGNNSYFDLLSCPSSTSCSALGVYYTANHTRQNFAFDLTAGTWGPLVTLTNGTVFPAGTERWVNSISCTSPGNCLTGGQAEVDANHSYPFVQEETNGVWGTPQLAQGVSLQSANYNGVIHTIDCASEGNCAVGGVFQPGSNTVPMAMIKTVASPPEVSSISSVSAGPEQATVTWPRPTTHGAPIKSWIVRAYTGGSTLVATKSDCTGSPCTVTGLTNGTAYTFTVTAKSAAGLSASSPASQSVTPADAPDAPTITTVNAGNTQATVTWSDGAANGATITSWTVRAYTDGPTLAATKSNCTGSPCTVTGLTNGTPYTFTVTSTNRVGTSEASAASAAVSPGAVPTAPSGVVGSSGDAQSTITWTAASGNGTAVLSYTASIVGHSELNCTYTVALPEVDSCVITGLTNGVAYRVQVTATNRVGAGPAGTSAATFTPRLPGGATPSITNLPTVAIHGTTLTPVVSNAGSGAVTVTSSTTTICTVAARNVVRFIAMGYCTLVAHVAASGSSAATTGAPQTVHVLYAGPTGVTASSGSSRNVVVHWVAPRDVRGLVTGYVATATANGVTAASCSASAQVTTCTIVGLVNLRTYAISVKASEGGAGYTSSTSLPSSAVNATPATPLYGMAFKPFDRRVKGSLGVSWSAAVGDNQATTYQVSLFNAAGLLRQTVSVSTRTTTFTGLVTGANYRIVVKATTPATVAGYIAPLTISSTTTGP